MKNKLLTIVFLMPVILCGLFGCQRMEPELTAGDLSVLKTIPSDRFYLMDTTDWQFQNQLGNFYNFIKTNASAELPGKGDYITYHDGQSAFFGQLISLNVSSDQIGMELAESPLNNLFDFFALRDTFLTIGNGYYTELASLATLNGDTLQLSGVKRSIRENNFTRGIIDFQNIALLDLSKGEQHFYLTPAWDDGVITRDALIRWDQDLTLSGTLLLTQYDQNEFADSLMLRKRTWRNQMSGFPIDFVVEEWMMINWKVPGIESLHVDFLVDGETQYASRIQEGGSWIQSASANFTESAVAINGWNHLESGWLNLGIKTVVKPIFGGRGGLSISKNTSLMFDMEADWPLWTLSAELIQKDQFLSAFGLFSDIGSLEVSNEVYTAEVLNLEGELENEPPTAAFTISPPTGYTNTSFKFNGGSSIDVEDQADQLQIRWDFENDGNWDTNYSTNKLVTHQYFFSGVYSVKMQVIDSQGATDEIIKELTVYETSSAPIAAFSVNPETGKQTDVFTFDASACYDAEDLLSQLVVRWDFENDGTWDTQFSTTKAQAWIFRNPGEFVVKLEVKDTDGLTGSTTKLIKVTEGNIKPEAYFTVNPASGTTATRFSFDASESSDTEDPVEELMVRWDFENDGEWDTELRTVKTVSHQFTIAGNYTAVLEVHDTDGFSNTFTRVIVVSNPNTAPEANFIIRPREGTIETKFLFDASLSTDLEDDDSTLEVRWDWNNDDIWDTDFSTDKTISKQFDFIGSKVVRVQVRDSGGLTDIKADVVVINP